MSVPPSQRDPKTLEEFTRFWRLNTRQVARLFLSEYFWKAVMEDTHVFQARLSSVREAMYKNATNSALPTADQWFWMQQFFILCGAPGYEKVVTPTADGKPVVAGEPTFSLGPAPPKPEKAKK